MTEAALLALSACLVALSFPSDLSLWGLYPLAYVALAPLLIVVHRTSWPRLLVYAPIYGLVSYSLVNIWLLTWHPLAIFVVPAIHAAYFLALLPVLKIVDTGLPRSGYVVQTVVWVAYEYLKTRGFLGYPYGIIGYTQVPFIPLIQIAAVTGVWGVSALVVFPSALLSDALKDGLRGAAAALRKRAPAAGIYGAVLAGVLAYGLMSQVDTVDVRKWRVALIQQNVDPWRGGDEAYRLSLDVLTRLSTEALAAAPDVEAVIWSETSFVPSIDWHTRYRTDDQRYRYVRQLREFLDGQRVAYVIGNNDGQRRRLPNGQDVRVDYNATLLYRDGEIVDIYRKLHLVPFTEHFPYRGVLTWMSELLQSFDIHHYEKGKTAVVYEDRGIRFSTPICFEDSFGYLGRKFVNAGADVLVNMSNDSWANSVAAEMQHMAMGVLRAVENRRSLVRSTNGGMTIIADANGRVLQMLEPFTAAYLVGEVPVVTGVTTLYSRWGDWFAVAALVLSIGFVVVLTAFRFVHRAGSRASGRPG